MEDQDTRKLSYKEGDFQKRWGFWTERFVWLEMLRQMLFARDFDGFKEAFFSLDGYLAERQITVDSITSDQDKEYIGKAAGGALFGLAITFVALTLIGLGYTIFWIGSAPKERPAGLPGVVATPTARPVENVWATYSPLTQAQARELRTKENVLNFALLDGGGATYLADYGVHFDPTNPAPWKQQNQPLGLTNFSITGTAISVGADNNTYGLNVYQGFARVKAPTELYVVDQLGNIWVTTYSDTLLVPFDQIQPQVHVLPNSNLSLTY